MNKTYLPNVERRTVVRPNQYFNILSYDRDNAYPQRVLEYVHQAPTGKLCWMRRARFLAGVGFEDSELQKQIINGNGLTMGKLLKLIAIDQALFIGFGIHFNYNANYQAVSAHYVKFEDIRQGNTDNPNFRGKYLVYPDWGHKTWKNILKSKVAVLDPFNPDPEVIKAQVIAAGGWDKYKGQLFYSNPVVDDYPLAKPDDAIEDLRTEAGIKTFHFMEMETGFLPSTMLFMQSRREEADNAEFDGVNPVSAGSQIEQDLGKFQGAKNGQKIIVIEYDDPSAKPEMQAYPIQNNDKLFEVTERSVEARIIKSFEIPKELVSSTSKTGLGDSGGDKREAIKELNDNTAGERMEISEAFAKVFSVWYENINPSGNWNILEVPTEGAGQTNIQNSDKIQTLITGTMPKANKISILMYVYGFSEKEAAAMIPEDTFFKEQQAQTLALMQQKNNNQTEKPKDDATNDTNKQSDI